jgi:hypothetical protein
MEKLDQWLTRAVQSLSLKRLIPSRGFLLKLGLRLLQLVLIVLAWWVLFKLRILYCSSHISKVTCTVYLPTK